MVTAAAVWAAFEQIPDPEIPVVSLVDLGVIRSVDVRDGRVHVEFTPTFLGCPALEVMKRSLEASVRELGAEPEVEVVNDGSWGTDKITAEGREKLRVAGFAPPGPRPLVAEGDQISQPGVGGFAAGASSLVQLQSQVHKCPYCGSTDTRLENLFGPTPCRSIRYCNGCRQPFEQFKTI